jgi:hypothetical protein
MRKLGLPKMVGGGFGTVFKITADGTVVPSVPLSYLTLWPDGGQQPGVSTLNAIPDGTLYGTTMFGGIANPSCMTGGGYTGCGTVYNLQPSSRNPGAPSNFWKESVLYDFKGGTDGATPYGALLICDKAGNLHGTAFGGGTGKCPGSTLGCAP